jgi:hypothetical protein
LALCLGLLSGAPARAQEPRASAGTPPCDTSRTPSPCVQPGGAYTHDGFYFAFTTGLGYLTFTGEGVRGDASISDMTGTTSLAVGGSPAPGLAVGGGLRLASIRARFHGSPHDPEGYATAELWQLGPFVEWYPNPLLGWHVAGAFTLGELVVQDSYLPDAAGTAGFVTVYGGHNWWLGPEWSLGLRALASASTRPSLVDGDGNETDYAFRAWFAGVESALTFH